MARLVLVDDSRIARANLKLMLADEHEIVGEGGTGLEGIELYKEHRPDLIFLDVTMPEMSGIDCFKKILEFYPDAKAIFVTSVHKSQTEIEVMHLGALSYITKPFSRKAILSAVRHALS